jgi:hypothetical protein
MATNLRLTAETELALRQRSERTGRSQQDLIRTALDEYLGLVAPAAQTLDELVASGVASEPRPLVTVAPISLPADLSSLDLLQREDRI